MTSLKSSTKVYCDNAHDNCEANKTDSGFLSGANLLSEENLSCENFSTSALRGVNFHEDEKNKDNLFSTQSDSGVDIGLNEQFNKLALDKTVCIQNQEQYLQKTSKCNTTNALKKNLSSSKSVENKSNTRIVSQPWELYFQQDEEGDTQLHIAIIQGFIEVVYSLIKMVPHPCFLDILNDMVQSPLHLAVLTHQPKIVRRLILAGASIKTRDQNGNTPLHLACQLGDTECVKSLTEPITASEIHIANIHYTAYSQQIPQDFEDKNYEGETCLHLAAQGSHLEILKHLIWYGANINARENKSGRTILHYAVETLNYTLLQFLLEDCPYGTNGLLLDMKNYAGHTAYQLARIIDIKIARDLMNKGAHISVDDIEEEDHPDHNLIDDEDDMTMECVHFETEDFPPNKHALSA